MPVGLHGCSHSRQLHVGHTIMLWKTRLIWISSSLSPTNCRPGYPRCGHAPHNRRQTWPRSRPVGNQFKLNITQYGKHQLYSYVVSEPADAPAFFPAHAGSYQGTSQPGRRCGFLTIEEKLRLKLTWIPPDAPPPVAVAPRLNIRQP